MLNKATIYTYTIIYIATEAFKDRTPYVVALVDDGKQKLFTRIEGYDTGKEINIGTEVQLSHFNENGKPVYKFI